MYLLWYFCDKFWYHYYQLCMQARNNVFFCYSAYWVMARMKFVPCWDARNVFGFSPLPLNTTSPLDEIVYRLCIFVCSRNTLLLAILVLTTLTTKKIKNKRRGLWYDYNDGTSVGGVELLGRFGDQFEEFTEVLLTSTGTRLGKELKSDTFHQHFNLFSKSNSLKDLIQII